jgi:phosphatidate cytidylyltransferase
MPSESPDRPRHTLAGVIGLIPHELRLRAASGIAIGLVAFAMLYWSPTAFAVLTFFVAAAMSWEWSRIVRGTMPDAGLVVHIATVLVAAVLTAKDEAGLAIAAVAAGAVATGFLAWGWDRARLSATGVFYTALPVVALGWLRGDEPLGFLATLFVIISVAITDIAAFVVGRAVGGPKLWPEVSPNKTWSGLFGGILAAAAGGALYSLITGTGGGIWLASLALAVGLVAQWGDLGESALKRHFGLKDAGGLIPGHGGFMDRMDGLVTASIAAAVVALLIDAYAPARALLYGS